MDMDAVAANFPVRTPTGTDDPLSDKEIAAYREEIDKMNDIILSAIKRRTEVSDRKSVV